MWASFRVNTWEVMTGQAGMGIILEAAKLFPRGAPISLQPAVLTVLTSIPCDP